MKQVFCYTRVSTTRQDEASQQIGIDDYLDKNGILSWRSYSEKVSGATSWEDRKLKQLLDEAKEDDLIIVSELSRIGRSTSDVLRFIEQAVKKGVKIAAVKNNILLDGSITSVIFATVLGLAAEIERDFIRQRTKEGMANAAAKGVKFGRPKGASTTSILSGKDNQIQQLIAAGVPITSIAKLTGTNRATVTRYLKITNQKGN